MGDKKHIGRYHEKRGEDYLTVYKSDDGDVVQIEQYDARSAYSKLRGIDFFTESIPGLIKLLQKAAEIKAEKVEYEYAVQLTVQGRVRSIAHWTTKQNAQDKLDFGGTGRTAEEDPIFGPWTAKLVKRRKAGKVEDA